MKIREEVLIDYLDGTLDEPQRAQVEAQLAHDDEMTALMADIAATMPALHEDETPAPTLDLWPRIREGLPAKAGSPLGRLVPSSLRRTLNGKPSTQPQAAEHPAWINAVLAGSSPWRVSVKLAAVAAFVALAVFMLSPRQSVHNLQADALSAADQTFITQSLKRHAAYETTRTLSTAPIVTNVAGDGRNSEGDNPDEGGDDPYIP